MSDHPCQPRRELWLSLFVAVSVSALGSMGALGCSSGGSAGGGGPGSGGRGSDDNAEAGGRGSDDNAESGGQAGGPGSPNDIPVGNPDADESCDIPSDAALEDVSSPTTIVGTGTAGSCTADAFISAVEAGGVITFNCGAAPHTIVLDRPAKVRNDHGPRIVIDGGGQVTLSGGGTTRILYMNTCDEAQTWTTSHCDNQDHPQLTVQNLTFIDGNSKNESENDGGGAIFASGGRFKAVNTRFFNNVCADSGPDVGGAGLRVFQQFENRPAYVVNSTFGGAPELGNVCSNGGGLSSIGVNWHIINSLFSHNRAIGNGGNPAQDGTTGGGSGGAIYNDGNTLHLKLCGTKIEDNTVNAFGSAIFFISNNHQGTLELEKSVIANNHGGSWYALPGISMHDDTARIIDASSVISD
jgi:hypothetical protein